MSATYGSGSTAGRSRARSCGPNWLVVLVPADERPAAGDTVDVEVSIELRLPYMQIAPMRYVTNHATNRRAYAVH